MKATQRKRYIWWSGVGAASLALNLSLLSNVVFRNRLDAVTIAIDLAGVVVGGFLGYARSRQWPGRIVAPAEDVLMDRQASLE